MFVEVRQIGISVGFSIEPQSDAFCCGPYRSGGSPYLCVLCTILAETTRGTYRETGAVMLRGTVPPSSAQKWVCSSCVHSRGIGVIILMLAT